MISFPVSARSPASSDRSDCACDCPRGTETRSVELVHLWHPTQVSITPTAHSAEANYFLALIFFLTLLPSALDEVTLKVSFTRSAQSDSPAPEVMWSTTFANSAVGEKSTYSESSSASGA